MDKSDRYSCSIKVFWPETDKEHMKANDVSNHIATHFSDFPPWSVYGFCKFACRHALLLGALSLTSLSCSENKSPAISEPPPPRPITSYAAPRSSGLILDVRLRERSPDLKLGASGELIVGSEGETVYDILLLDSSVVYSDSIPNGSEIVACTLWVKVTQLAANDNDSVVLDLYSCDQDWDESTVSWIQRRSGQNWLIAGGGGRLFSSAMVCVKRLDVETYEWRLSDLRCDTLKIIDALYVPIPLDTALARENYLGTSLGMFVRSNPSTTTGASFHFASSESSEAHRPAIVWVYR